MKRTHYAILVVIIMATLSVGTAHSGSGSLGASTNKSPVPNNDPINQTYVISEYEPVIITCGGDVNISEGERFKVLFGGEAFIDRATCLIWEMNPLQQDLTLSEAENHCKSLQIGNRNDWRVPHLFDLMLLEDSIDGSERPWDMAYQCYSSYAGDDEYHCKGWTNTPAIGGPAGSYYTIIMNHGALNYIDLNNLAYPFCVSGAVKSGN